jgi:hypothetical protein
MASMTTPEHNQRQPISCESDAWPYSADLEVFEARRAVGQLFRTITSLITPQTTGVLGYIVAADAISDALHDVVLPELVAQARAEGIPWAAIGKTYGVGEKAAQKRFRRGIDPDHYDQAREEGEVVALTNGFATTDPRSSDDTVWTEAVGDLEGTTPAERMKYAFGLMRGAYISFTDAEHELKAEDREPDNAKVADLLNTGQKKLSLAAETVLIDPEQWAAVIEWSGQPGTVDASHYYAPATYMFYGLRQLMLASNYSVRADRMADIDINKSLQLVMTANEILQHAMMILARADIRSVLPPEITSRD